jgi:septal ring factor EnvC (AmiA/AmiB activator)
MRRRTFKGATPVDQKQEELALRETELRDEVEKLQRMIADAPRRAEETRRRQQETLLTRASEGSDRLNVSLAPQDQWGNTGRYDGPRVSLRKERREGRIVFLFLVIVLTAAVVWLVSHFHFW